MKKFLGLAFAFLLFSGSIFAQDQKSGSNYDQHTLFNPLFYPSNGNEFRSASGQPGPKYWQNRADYSIKVTLDTVAHSVSGSVLIKYTNNSPDELPFLWLQVDQNIYKNDYWNVFELDDIPSQDIAHQMFDTAVNCGTSRAIRIAQQVIGMTITGKWNEELKYNLMQYGKD